MEQVNKERFHLFGAAAGGFAFTQNKGPGLFFPAGAWRLEVSGIRGKDPHHKKYKLLTDQQEGLEINEDCVVL